MNTAHPQDSQITKYQKQCKIKSFAFRNEIYNEMKFQLNCLSILYSFVYTFGLMFWFSIIFDMNVIGKNEK